jgi:protoheme IX farnesyltransferase
VIKHYFALTKPGIIFGNLITAIGGFAMASRGHIDGWLFIATLAGLTLVVASACVFNNYMDLDADKKMARTKRRPLVKGQISGTHALLFGTLLIVLGLVVLCVYTNLLTAFLALVGFLAYVLLYGICKYLTSYGTLIGSISGAVPPVVGYCAVSNRLDWGAFILFMIVVFWQMPHFYAIAIYRLKDYAAASIPVLPLQKGMYVTKVHMLLYVIAFILASLSPTLFGYTGLFYLYAMGFLGLIWLILSIKGFGCSSDQRWARKMFIFSLIIITALCALIFFSGLS